MAEKIQLDLLDRKTMYELDLDARLSIPQLARKVRRSKETVNFRLRRLLDEGYLKGFYTVFNTSKLGWHYYKIYLKFKDATPAQEEEIFAYLEKQPRIAYLASLEGHYDCICLVMVKDAEGMQGFLRQFMKKYGNFVLQKDIVTFLTTHRLNLKFLHAGQTRKDWHYPVKLGSYELDETDRRVLNCISSNARLPLTSIAKQAGVDAKVVKYRLRKLEKDGIILAYVTSPNFDRLGLQFVQINFSLNDPGVSGQIIEYFDSTNCCLFALEMIGKYDLAVELHVEGSEQLKKIVNGFKEKFVGKYADYDISTVTREYLIVWSPFAWDKTG